MNETMPLKGIKVVDLSQYMSGPACAQILADWGADVIKVEGLAGDPNRAVGATINMPCSDTCNPFFGFINYNKRSIALDLKSPEGMEAMDALLAQADVFITNWRTKALLKRGLDYETLHRKYPRLVWGTINGFGNYGPEKDNAGYDTVAFWAKTGFMIDQVESGGDPAIPFYGVGDNAAGTALAGAVGTGLFQRERTGQGCEICVTLYGTGIWSSSSAVMQTQYHPEVYPKTRNAPSDPLVNTYRTKDGDWIMTSVFSEDKLPHYLKALGLEELNEDTRFSSYSVMLEHRQELLKLLEQAYGSLSTEEVCRRLQEEDIAYNQVMHSVDVHRDPQAMENGFVTEYTHPDGTKTMIPMPPVMFGDRQELVVHRPYPKVGEQSVEILKELGFPEEKIRNMLERGVMRQSE